MSAEALISTPPPPGKDPPLRPSSTSPLNRIPAPASEFPSNLPLSASRSMPPPKRQIQTTSASILPLQTSEIPQTPSAPRPLFSPFFTLIDDASARSSHHPSRIHYIFSDDDESEILKAACVRSLQHEIEDESPAASRDLGGSEQGIRESETSSSSSATFRTGEKRKDAGVKGKAPVKREERAIIVDINETVDGIVSASSLSSSWQIINADISNAPTFNNDSTGEGTEEGERGLMLKIEGVGVSGSGFEGELGDSGEKRKGKGVGEGSVVGEEELQALLESFDRKMSLLRKIVASGESWDEARKDKVVGDGDAEVRQEV